MSKFKSIYLIRHGETDWNRDKRIQGQSDIPLNETGKEQARLLIPKMAQLEISDFYSSDLARALETAQIATSDLGGRVNIKKDIRFRETHLGEAEGLTFDEIIERHGPEGLVRWRSYEELDLDFKFPQGESKRQMMIRVRDALLETVQNSTAERIAIFCHGMIMRATTFAFDQGTEWDLNLFSNGSIHSFEWQEKRPNHLKYFGKMNP